MTCHGIPIGNLADGKQLNECQSAQKQKETFRYSICETKYNEI